MKYKLQLTKKAREDFLDLDRKNQKRIATKLRFYIQQDSPIKFAKKEIAIRIPGEYTGKAYSALKSITNFKKEDWGNDGSFMCVVEIPAGMQDDLFDKVNNITQGNADLKILKIID